MGARRDKIAAERCYWEKSLDQAVELLGIEQTGIAWQAISDELGRSWRGSMLAECVIGWHSVARRPVCSAGIDREESI